MYFQSFKVEKKSYSMYLFKRVMLTGEISSEKKSDKIFQRKMQN